MQPPSLEFPSRFDFLIVEDDAAMRTLVPTILGRILGRAATLHVAASPSEALALVATLPRGPLVVLSDFNLKSDLDGIQLLERLAAERPECVRILYSGNTREEIGSRVSSPALHAFIEKPWRLSELPNLLAPPLVSVGLAAVPPVEPAAQTPL